jgi:hypothetical protein
MAVSARSRPPVGRPVQGIILADQTTIILTAPERLAARVAYLTRKRRRM